MLEEAANLIDGARNETYGTPTQNFTNIAEMWNTRFSHLLKDGAKFTPSDVADAMILLKMSRNIAGKKRDNYVDVAGYAGCGWEAEQASQDAASDKTQESTQDSSTSDWGDFTDKLKQPQDTLQYGVSLLNSLDVDPGKIANELLKAIRKGPQARG